MAFKMTMPNMYVMIITLSIILMATESRVISSMGITLSDNY